MRNISAASLAKLSTTQGIEPISIVRIWWTDSGYIDYADRTVESVRGRLLSLSDIEDVINLAGNSSSTTVSVTLDDSDGELKEIFNNIDIHRRRVQILQWFNGLPLAEAFVIFEGEVASPVEWAEGDRTLSFEVLSKLEDREVGFSAEEGSFNYIPPELVGKPWPLVFGTVNGVPALQANKAPSGLSGRELGVIDEKTNDDNINGMLLKLEEIRLAGLRAISIGLAALAKASEFQALQVLANQDGTGEDYSSDIEHWESVGEDYETQANQYLEEYGNLNKEIDAARADAATKDTLKKNSIPVAGSDNFPQRATAVVKIGNQTYQGYFDAGNFNITSHPDPFDDDYVPAGLTTITERTVITEYSTQLPPSRFIHLPGGSDIRIAGIYPVTHIAAIGHVTVFGVSAYRNGILTGVPPNYYSVEHKTFGSFLATFIVFPTPLSSVDSGWEDQIYVNIQSEVGPSAIDIMLHLIQQYTPYSWDDDSFSAARTYVDLYPANFALMSRPNVIQLLQQIAFQSRCAIWFNDGKFFLKFLPAESDAIETITKADIDVNSVIVSYTETEEVVTKFVAKWYANLSQEEPNKIIFRNNIRKYGTIEEEYDYFIYNIQEIVEKSAEFWTIRKSNVWKRIAFRTFIHKLKIETWDTILLDIDDRFVADTDIKAVVESAKYDSSTGKINVVCWVPVRAGEMTKYDFAWPADLPIEYVYPVPDDIQPGSPTAPNATGDIVDTGIIFGIALDGTPLTRSTRGRPDTGRQLPIGDVHDPAFSVTTQLDSREIVPGLAPVLTGKTYKQYLVKPLVEPTIQSQDDGSGFWFGIVRTQVDGKKYNVDVYRNGIRKNPKSTVVEQFVIRDDEIIPNGTPCMVTRQVTIVESDDIVPILKYDTTYAMQVPVWVTPPEEETPPTTPVPEEEPDADTNDDGDVDETDDGVPYGDAEAAGE